MSKEKKALGEDLDLKLGAPTKYSEANLKMIRYMALKGATDKEMSEVLDVTEQTFNNWKKSHPDFFESLKDWKNEADEKVERSLYERATGYSHKETKFFCHEGMIISEDTEKNYPPDATSMIFWLKNRKPKVWRDKTEVDQINLDVQKPYEQYLKDLEKDNGQE